MAIPQYNACLCLYYLLVIKYNVKDEVLEKYEKYMHAYAIIPNVGIAVVAASLDMLNPGQLDYCGLSDGCKILFIGYVPDCQPRHRMFGPVIKYTASFFCVLDLVIIIVSMILLYLSVHKQAEKMKKYQSFKKRNSLNGDDTGANKQGGLHRETLIQSSLYVLAFFLTFMWPSIAMMVEAFEIYGFAICKAIFFPLQGFWNFFAYIRPRFVKLKEKKPNKSFWWILHVVVFGGNDEENDEKKNFNTKKAQPTIAKLPNTTQRISSTRLEILERAKNNDRKTADTTKNIKVNGNNTEDDTLHGDSGADNCNNISSDVINLAVSRVENLTTCNDDNHINEESKEELSAGSWGYDTRFEKLSSNVEKIDCDDLVTASNKAMDVANKEDEELGSTQESVLQQDDYIEREQDEKEKYLTLSSFIAQDVFNEDLTILRNRRRKRQSRRTSLPSYFLEAPDSPGGNNSV